MTIQGLAGLIALFISLVTVVLEIVWLRRDLYYQQIAHIEQSAKVEGQAVELKNAWDKIWALEMRQPKDELEALQRELHSTHQTIGRLDGEVKRQEERTKINAYEIGRQGNLSGQRWQPGDYLNDRR